MNKFISFGDGPYRKSVKRLEKQIQRTKLFDYIKTYNFDNIGNDFSNRYGRFIEFNKNTPRGSHGFWIWKLHIIFEEIMRSKNEDVIFYIDAGCHINQKNLPRLEILIDITKALPDDRFAGLAFKLEDFRQIKYYTKPSLLEEFSEIDHKLPQLAATYVFFKVNNNSRYFIREWLKIASKNSFQYLDDSIVKKIDDNLEYRHRHDQAIFTLLVYKLKNFLILNDEGWPLSDPNKSFYGARLKNYKYFMGCKYYLIKRKLKNLLLNFR
jgi:hypothetical protein